MWTAIGHGLAGPKRQVNSVYVCFAPSLESLLRLSSKATFPRDLNSLEGSCPWSGPWAWAHGAHLATQVESERPETPWFSVLEGLWLWRARQALASPIDRGVSLRGCNVDLSIEGSTTTITSSNGLFDAILLEKFVCRL